MTGYGEVVGYGLMAPCLLLAACFLLLALASLFNSTIKSDHLKSLGQWASRR
jgi:hypothetical protein